MNKVTANKASATCYQNSHMPRFYGLPAISFCIFLLLIRKKAFDLTF
jgi:hypothetical protein